MFSIYIVILQMVILHLHDVGIFDSPLQHSSKKITQISLYTTGVDLGFQKGGANMDIDIASYVARKVDHDTTSMRSTLNMQSIAGMSTFNCLYTVRLL